MARARAGQRCPRMHLRPVSVPTPGPRWAVVTVAAVAAVLAASCLLCVLCCCCGRRTRGRKPRGKEAVGLARVRSTATPHLVSGHQHSVPSARLGQSQGAAAGPGPGSGRPGEVGGDGSLRMGWSAQKQGPAGLPGRGPMSRMGGKL